MILRLVEILVTKVTLVGSTDFPFKEDLRFRVLLIEKIY